MTASPMARRQARVGDPQDQITRLYIGLALQALERPSEAAAEFEYVVEKGSDPELRELSITYLQGMQE